MNSKFITRFKITLKKLTKTIFEVGKQLLVFSLKAFEGTAHGINEINHKTNQFYLSVLKNTMIIIKRDAFSAFKA